MVEDNSFLSDSSDEIRKQSEASQRTVCIILLLFLWHPLSPLLCTVYLYYASTKLPISRNIYSITKRHILLAPARELLRK